MKRKKNVVLIGMTGCGKTTVGLALSYRLKMPFVDMDKWIEQKSGKPIPAIFSQGGEQAFRALETKAAKEVSKYGGTIISTGGGVVTRPENMKYLKKNAVVVYINRSVEDIKKNLKLEKRPMLKGRTDTLYRMYSERNGLYRKYADIVVVNRTDFQEGVDNVYDAVKDMI